MTTTEKLLAAIAPLNLQNHPFYQDWMAGKLSMEHLQDYAVQYYPHVKDFPRFVSTIHSQCEDVKARRLLLENLMDEEGVNYDADHPQLWRDFASGLGVSTDAFTTSAIQPKAKNLQDTYWQLCRSSYAEGLAALYAYEYQVPGIASLKIEGLKKNYQLEDAKTLAFFSVHEKADEYHSEACAQLLNQLNPEDSDRAIAAARSASQALWDFLTEVHQAAGNYGTAPSAC